jgi:hypothetical protein
MMLFSCSEDSLVFSDGESAISGSYARMLSIGDFLYVLDYTNMVTLNVSNKEEPVFVQSQEVGDDIETIFFSGELLFIGSPSGLYIYTIQENGVPAFLSITPYEAQELWVACDPVVANDTLAFVTLSTSLEVENSGCTRFVQVNELRIFDIKNPADPVLLSITQMEEPKGLALDDTLLFICEKSNGLRIFNVENPLQPLLIRSFFDFEAYDVIAYNGLLVLVGPNEIKQFDYSDPQNIEEISTLILKN